MDLSVCTDVIYAATDSWPYENSWDIVDATGAVIASGADASGNVGACPVYGCTDPAATNYDPAATNDDGSCILSCTVAPYTQNFDAGVVPADWTNNGWTIDLLGTPSSNTGPSDDITGGGYYMFYETSGVPQSPITLTSLCLDVQLH